MLNLNFCFDEPTLHISVIGCFRCFKIKSVINVAKVWESALNFLKKYEKVCWKLFTIWNSIIKQPTNLIQKISSHSDAQKRKTKSVLILLWQKINKNRSQNIIKDSAFYRIQNFFCFFLSKHSFGTWAKCICSC